jgi:Ca2+-binding EF-hand superfamily protein
MCTSRLRNVARQSLAGVAALATAIAGGIATAGGDAPSLPLQGPIPFEAFDLDGSGAISQQEFDELHGRRAEERAEAGLPAPRQSQSFGSVDADGDGAITREELQAAQGAGRAGPGRGRGMRGGRGRGMGGDVPVFSDFDLNGDGRIDEPEFAKARAARVNERAGQGRMLRGMASAPPFSDLDADGDGSLTPDEFAAGVRSHWHGTPRGGAAEVEP